MAAIAVAENTRVFLLDIEGTTTPITFVKVMLPVRDPDINPVPMLYSAVSVCRTSYSPSSERTWRNICLHTGKKTSANKTCICSRNRFLTLFSYEYRMAVCVNAINRTLAEMCATAFRKWIINKLYSNTYWIKKWVRCPCYAILMAPNCVLESPTKGLHASEVKKYIAHLPISQRIRKMFVLRFSL